MKETFITSCPVDRIDDSDCESEYERPTQAIAGRNIDPIKLKILLRTKFGAGSFEVQVSSNVHQHISPWNLAPTELESMDTWLSKSTSDTSKM
jgi:hypothetical protein